MKPVKNIKKLIDFLESEPMMGTNMLDGKLRITAGNVHVEINTFSVSFREGRVHINAEDYLVKGSTQGNVIYEESKVEKKEIKEDKVEVEEPPMLSIDQIKNELKSRTND